MSEKYLGENSTPLLINQIKENCTQKRSTLPIASIDELGNTYQYTGTTSGSLVHGYFYECVVASENPTTYGWQQVNIQPTAGTPTASGTTFDNTTSGLQATNVQDAIDEVEGRVDNIEGKVPSTATSSNKLVDHDSLGTAAFKDSTDRVSPNNTDLVESQSVYSAINTALSSIYTPRGDITCAELTSDLLIAANVGNVYETSDSGTTTALFLQGAGHPIAVGSNVGIINAGEGRILFNLMANAFDLTDYQKKDLTQAVEGATTVEGALGALSTNKQAKTLTTSVESQTTVEGALGALSTNKATQAEVNDIVNVLGAKNLLPNNAVSQTIDGVTFTVNADGSITANGTATPSSNIIISSAFNLVGGEYILSDEANSTDANVQMILETPDGAQRFSACYGATRKMKFTLNQAYTLKCFIWISSGTTVDNVTFKPMLRLASIQDDTYEPYSMTNREITPYVQAISNPNLLDNPWFTVNQRGLSSYSGPNYTVDRWGVLNDKGTLTVNADGSITVTASGGDTWLRQKFDPELLKKLVGKTITVGVDAVKTGGNVNLYSGYYDASNTWHRISEDVAVKTSRTIVSRTAIVPTLEGGEPKFGEFGIYIQSGQSVTIYSTKLEIGSVSTLAMDCPPNYTTELLKCQRYFQRIKGDSTNKVRLLFGLVSTTTTIQVQLPFAVPMRISNATITYSTNGILYGKTSTTTTVASDISLDPSSSICRNCLVIGTGLTVGETMPIYLDVGAYIDLSADL